MKLLARFVKRISYRWVTLRSLFGHFSSAQRAFLLPLVILVLLAVLLLPVFALFVLGWRATRRRRPS